MKEIFIKFKVALVFATIILISCNNQTQTTTAVSDQPAYFKTLIVIGDDRSGSTTDIRKLDSIDYQTIISSIAKKGGGAVAVCLIGNPQPQSKEPYIIYLEPLEIPKAFDPKDTELTLSQKGAFKINNEKIIAKNNLILSEVQTKTTHYIKHTLIPNIINYKASGADFTDLDDAFTRINTLINETQYKDFERIIVAILSDGKNQPGIKSKPITAKINHPKAEIFLVGWKTGTECFEGLTIENLSEKSGLINIITNLKHK